MHNKNSTNVNPKLCLNMIVKNESKIIRRLFDSVCNIIDSYCICDTGSTDGMNAIEKNWTLFAGLTGALKTVYGWYPFTLYKSGVQQSNLPPFFKDVRGSCNGIAVGSETWFLCHTVSYEIHRYYYHIIIVLDAETSKVKRWTKYFTFEGKHIEYALGFLYDESKEEFMLGYSVMDRTTEFKRVSKKALDSLFIK